MVCGDVAAFLVVALADLITQQFAGHPFAGRRGIWTRADSSNKVQVVAYSDGSVPFEGSGVLKPRSRLPPLFRWAASHGCEGVGRTLRSQRPRRQCDGYQRANVAAACRSRGACGHLPLADRSGCRSLAARRGWPRCPVGGRQEQARESGAAVLRICLSTAAVPLGDPAAEHSSTAGVGSEVGAAIAAGNDEIRNLADWEELIESPPPPDNQSLLLDARELQYRISRHVLVNRYDDWSDVEIDMPDVAELHNLDHAAWLEEVRDLIHVGLSCGWVTKSQLAELVQNNGDEKNATDIEARLRLVIGDVGIYVDDDHWAWEAVAGPGLRCDSQYDERGDRIVEDAITFLGDLSRGNDHLAHYYKDIKQIEAATVRMLHVVPRGRPAPPQESR